MKELILASTNPGKIREFNALLAPTVCLSQNSLGISEAIENGLSFDVEIFV